MRDFKERVNLGLVGILLSLLCHKAPKSYAKVGYMSGKTKEEIAFDLVAKLKGVGVWGENNMQEILDMYAECLEATSGLRKTRNAATATPPAPQQFMPAQTQVQAQAAPLQAVPQTQQVQAQQVQPQHAQTQPQTAQPFNPAAQQR